MQNPGTAPVQAAEMQVRDDSVDRRPRPEIPNRPMLPMPTSGRKEDMDAWLFDCALRRNLFGSGN
jgi:hypothetical protein